MIKKYKQISVSFSSGVGDTLMPLLGVRTAGCLLSCVAKKEGNRIVYSSIPLLSSAFPLPSPAWCSFVSQLN